MSEPLDYANPHHARRPNWAGRVVVGLGVALFTTIVFLTVGDVIRGQQHGVARIINRTVRCDANLRWIHQEWHRFATEHGGEPPRDWAELTYAADLIPEFFVCPASDDERSPARDEATLRIDFAAGGHCSYRYVAPPGPLATMPGDAIVALELSPNGDEHAHALLVDGRVVTVDPATLAALRQRVDAGERTIRWTAR